MSACRLAIVVTSPMPFVSGGMLLDQTIGASVAFARARSAVDPYAVVPETIREAAIGPRDGLPRGVFGQLGPFLILTQADDRSQELNGFRARSRFVHSS